MVETAIAWFGLSLPAALDLTLYQYRVYHRAQRRTIRDQHERDMRLAWLTAAMTTKPITYKALERLIAGKGSEDPELQIRRERIMAEFDDAYMAERAAEKAAAMSAQDTNHGG
jgi:hypothetical protein